MIVIQQSISSYVVLHKLYNRKYFHTFFILSRARKYTLHVYFVASQVVLVVKNPPAKAGDIRDIDSIPGGRSPGGGHGNPLQYCCLENPMNRGAWRAAVHRVTTRWTRLKRLSACYNTIICTFHLLL